MVPTSLRVIALVVTVVCTGQPAKSQPKSGAPASGVFTGRSGKPMANMRLILAEVTGDQELTYAKIKLAVSPPTAVTDVSRRCRGAVQDCLAKYRRESILLLLPLLVPIRALAQERRKGHVVDD
jgi:hypothetical protein